MSVLVLVVVEKVEVEKEKEEEEEKFLKEAFLVRRLFKKIPRRGVNIVKPD